MKKTPLGYWIMDFSGLWHYKCTKKDATILEATDDAFCTWRPSNAALFWFEGTFCPVHAHVGGETQRAVSERWQSWKEAYNQNPKYLLELMLKASEENNIHR